MSEPEDCEAAVHSARTARFLYEGILAGPGNRVDRACPDLPDEGPRAPPRSWIQTLTARERAVFARVLRAWPNWLIAEDLQREEATVKKHLQHVFDKLGVSSRMALIALAARSP